MDLDFVAIHSSRDMTAVLDNTFRQTRVLSGCINSNIARKPIISRKTRTEGIHKEPDICKHED